MYCIVTLRKYSMWKFGCKFGTLDGLFVPGHCLVGIIYPEGEGGIDGVLLAEDEFVCKFFPFEGLGGLKSNLHC